MRELQEAVYGEGADYRRGSPHLTHLRLYDRLEALLAAHVRDAAARGLPLRVLELGAGHGGLTSVALAAGCEVTAVEMSAPSVARLRERFGTNPGFRALHDPDGGLAAAGDGFAVLLCAAVLHHVPDYLAFLSAAVPRLLPGGSVCTLQDPLWYARRPALQHRADRGGYLLWRLRQGELRRGLATRTRRLRGVLDETSPSDMVEYHVVRDGVDERAVAQRLAPAFERVEVHPYWSNQSALVQRLGERAGWANSFAVSAWGARGGR